MSDSEDDFQIPSSDDEDYVPGADSEEGSDDEKKVRRSRRASTTHKTMPKRACRKKGISLTEDSDEDDEEEYISEPDEEPEESEHDDEEEEDEEEARKEEIEKKRIDDLWQNFKSETSTTEKNRGTQPVSEGTGLKEPENKKPKTIKVTQTYEFAGEVVKVTKEVEADSVEANVATKEEADESTGAEKKAGPAKSIPPKRRMGGGLGSVLGSINKKPKLSTLDKSKLDWEGFKEEEGITDDLRSKSKSGYLDKQEFLQRADYKQWENERELRLATSKFKK